MKIKLMPPFLLGRYFQALAIYLSKDLEVEEYGPDYIVVDDESYQDAIEELKRMVEKHLDAVRVQIPLYGNDRKYFFKKVLGEKVANELLSRDKQISEKLKKAKGQEAKELWNQKVEVWKELWKKVIEALPKYNKQLAHLQILKASVHKYPREFLKSGKDAEVKNVEDPRGETLAVAGALLSVLGNVENDVLMLLPPLPESMRENENFLNALRLRYEALEGIDLNYKYGRMPCSPEIFLQFIFANAFRTKLREKLDCLNPVDNLFVATVQRGGNRAMVKSVIPLMASEIACKLGKGEILETLLRQANVKPEQVGACVNDLFQYVLSNNAEHLYRCARRYADTILSKDEVERKAARKVLRELTKVIA